MEKQKYNIYAGMWMKLVESVNTEKQAWRVVSRLPFGSIYQVTNEKGEIRSEFVPY